MITTTEVQVRVRRFTPTGLTPEKWEWARGSVVDAVVAAEPASLEQAKILASRLCSFLSWVPVTVWDGQSRPDLSVVVTAVRVAEFTSQKVLPHLTQRSRDTYCVYLQRIRRGLSGSQLAPKRKSVCRVAAAVDFWPRVTHMGCLPSLVAAFERSGSTLNPAVWSGFGKFLSWDLQPLLAGRSQGSARVLGCGTLSSVHAGVLSLRAARLPSVEVVPAPNNQRSLHQGPREHSVTVVKVKMSRAAALRAAKAAMASHNAPPAVITVPALSPDLEAMVSLWSPTGVTPQQWGRVDGAARDAVRAYQPSRQSAVRDARSVVGSFSLWLVGREGRVEGSVLGLSEFLRPGVIEDYLTLELRDTPERSQASARSVLRQVVRNLSGGTSPRSFAYQPVQPPYSVIECAKFVTLARHQPTPIARRNLSAMVAMGLGAGLSAEDQRQVTPTHVREVMVTGATVVLVIDVPGTRARTVVVRVEYEDLLSEALALHAQTRGSRTSPLYGVKPDRTNGANKVSERVITATGEGVVVSAARMRSTWLVACMSSAVPLGMLLHASGLKSARTFIDLLPFCPPADPEAVAEIFHCLEPAPADSGSSSDCGVGKREVRS